MPDVDEPCERCAMLVARLVDVESRLDELEQQMEVEQRRATIAHELLSAHRELRVVLREFALARAPAGGAFHQRVAAQEEATDVYDRALLLWSKDHLLLQRYVHVDDVINALISPRAVLLEDGTPLGLRRVARAILLGQIRYGAPVDPF